MISTLNEIFGESVMSSEIKESIEKAWEARINENRQQVSEQLREEFAQKYEHDKTVIIEALDQMITEQLTAEIVEFTEDRKQLAEMKIRYAKKMQQDTEVLNEFVTRQLATEVRELHADQVEMAEKFGKLETFIIEALAQEITEFYQDKKDLTDTKVRLIREGRAEIKRVKEQFIKRAATLVEHTVDECLRSEITALKEDIDSARNAELGRQMFEAYAHIYQSSYLNEGSEIARLQNLIKTKDMAIREAANAVVTAEKVLEQKTAQVHSLNETLARTKTMNDLLSPLGSEQRTIMQELMAGVKTSKLQESFEKYLPAIIAGKQPQKKQALVEAREITGNRISNTNRSSEHDSSIVDIRRLAGLIN